MMKPFLRTLALALSVTVIGVMDQTSATTAVAQEGTGERAVIEILQVMHRDPTRVRAAILSVLDPRGSIGQIDDKLIIATTATNLQQLRTIIADVDVPPGRLIIGVDFAYQPGATDNDTQQESQAIEGQELIFVASTGEPDDDAAVTDDADPDTNGGTGPRMAITAEVLDDVAAVNLRVENMPGLSGSHIARVPLGVWQQINPPAPLVETDTETDSQPDIPAVAVRVDRVP